MLAYLNGILPLFALIGLGFLLRRWAVLPDISDVVFNRFLFAVGIPVFVFDLIVGVGDLAAITLPFLATMLLASLLTSLLTWFALSVAKGPRVVLAAGTVFSNSLFLGFPVVVALHGSEAAAPAAVAAIFYFVVPLLLMIAGFIVSGTFGGGAAAEAFRREILFSPLLWATLSGLFLKLSGLELPTAAARLVTSLSGAAPPLSLLTLGLFMARVKVPLARPAVLAAVGGKLLVHPALTALAAVLIGLGGLGLKVAVLMAAMPPAVAHFVVAQRYGIGEEESAALTVVATVASLVSLAAIGLLLA